MYCRVRLCPRSAHRPRAIGAISGAISATLMTFIGVAINYGFLVVWLKAAAVGYFVGVPLLMLIVPHVQRFVMRRAAI